VDWAGRLYWKCNDGGKAQIGNGPASCSFCHFGQTRSLHQIRGHEQSDAAVLLGEPQIVLAGQAGLVRLDGSLLFDTYLHFREKVAPDAVVDETGTAYEIVTGYPVQLLNAYRISGR
jgi:hypothetical protein